jgi:hypothetical protein
LKKTLVASYASRKLREQLLIPLMSGKWRQNTLTSSPMCCLRVPLGAFSWVGIDQCFHDRLFTHPSLQ